jgi:hypothetical protein
MQPDQVREPQQTPYDNTIEECCRVPCPPCQQSMTGIAYHNTPPALTEKATLKQVAGYNPALGANGSRGSSTCPAQARAAPALMPITGASTSFHKHLQPTVHGLAAGCQTPASMHKHTSDLPALQHCSLGLHDNQGAATHDPDLYRTALEHDPGSKQGHSSGRQAEQQAQPHTCDSNNDQGAV